MTAAARPVGRPRKMPRADEESALLDATAEVVAEVGPDRATVEAIAHRAGVNKAAVYAHAASKDELIARAVRRAVDRLVAAVADGRDRAAAMGDADPDDAWRLLADRLRAVVGHTAAHPVGARLLVATRASRAPEVQAELDGVRAVLVGRLSLGIRQRYAAAGLPLDRAADLLAALALAVVEAANQQVLDDPTVDLDALVEVMVGLLRNGLRGVDPAALVAIEASAGRRA